MHLRSPGQIDAAINTLRSLKTGCDNCESAHNAFDRAQKAYIDWVDNAHSQLKSLFAESELAEGLCSQSYREIQGLRETTPGAWQVLRREIKAQSERLEAMQHRLVGLKEFAERPGHLVVADSSAFLQGMWFEDFDWPTQLDPRPAVRLVIPILVIEELDQVKDRDRDGRARNRARRVIKRLREHTRTVQPGHPAALRDKVTIEVLTDDDWHRRRPNNDGEIIDQALLIEAMTGSPVRLVCMDAAMEFRARQRGLTVTDMPPSDDTVALDSHPAPAD